ncbi:MAG TPA: phasin family protein [Vitreimonas sp.]|uniref:phasin family protein n=1 Tax=Vitreimonas sp. TaxID=3069702 RepID=UPI002D25304B|nr:phasin family protein [Vitreimonas sp.]HYD86962.1 phasin family protein [Vitreimonas sp.]
MPAKTTNGADGAPDKTPFMFAVMPNPALHSIVASQRVALETARFWARRMHAYADQMEMLAGCSSPDEFARAQTRFIERMRDDYTDENRKLSALLTPPAGEGGADANPNA